MQIPISWFCRLPMNWFPFRKINNALCKVRIPCHTPLEDKDYAKIFHKGCSVLYCSYLTWFLFKNDEKILKLSNNWRLPNFCNITFVFSLFSECVFCVVLRHSMISFPGFSKHRKFLSLAIRQHQTYNVWNFRPFPETYEFINENPACPWPTKFSLLWHLSIFKTEAQYVVL